MQKTLTELKNIVVTLGVPKTRYKTKKQIQDYLNSIGYSDNKSYVSMNNIPYYIFLSILQKLNYVGVISIINTNKYIKNYFDNKQTWRCLISNHDNYIITNRTTIKQYKKIHQHQTALMLIASINIRMCGGRGEHVVKYYPLHKLNNLNVDSKNIYPIYSIKAPEFEFLLLGVFHKPTNKMIPVLFGQNREISYYKWCIDNKFCNKSHIMLDGYKKIIVSTFVSEYYVSIRDAKGRNIVIDSSYS